MDTENFRGHYLLNADKIVVWFLVHAAGPRGTELMGVDGAVVTKRAKHRLVAGGRLLAEHTPHVLLNRIGEVIVTEDNIAI